MDTKELQEMAFQAVEKAKASGKIRKGSNEATKAIEKGSAKLVVSAKDTNPKEVIMHLSPLCKEKDIPYIEVDSRQELGTAAGLPVSTAAVAVVAEGDAKTIIKRITDALKDGETE
jgi:large subunit ribosomal protein L7Ae